MSGRLVRILYNIKFYVLNQTASVRPATGREGTATVRRAEPTAT